MTGSSNSTADRMPGAAESGARDEVAEQRERKAQAALERLPRQRMPAGALSEPDREEYEQRLDAYEAQLEEYRELLREAASQLEAAHRDGLTGAWLRNAGRQLLEQELVRASRSAMPLSVGFSDVDGLKALNDGQGHAAGDRALRAVATALLAGLRGYDHVVRWGGDEFLAVLPGMDREQALSRLEQARAELAELPEAPRISIGVAAWVPGESAEQLVGRADVALFRARRRSRA